MRNHTLILSAAAVVLLGSVASGPTRAGIKCWTNADGVRECGNVVPPEYAQQGHEELSKQGLTVKRTARAKTPEELEAEREAERQQAERERVEQEQLARDQVLLDTFTTEDDLILARDGKLASIDSRIGHTEQIARQLERELSELEAEAALMERSGKAVPDSVLAEIEATRRQIEENMLFIDERSREKEEIRSKFDADLARYRELKE